MGRQLTEQGQERNEVTGDSHQGHTLQVLGIHNIPQRRNQSCQMSHTLTTHPYESQTLLQRAFEFTRNLYQSPEKLELTWEWVSADPEFREESLLTKSLHQLTHDGKDATIGERNGSSPHLSLQKEGVRDTLRQNTQGPNSATGKQEVRVTA